MRLALGLVAVLALVSAGLTFAASRTILPGAVASMVGGALTAPVWKVASLGDATGFHPMLAGVIVSTTLIVAVSLIPSARRFSGVRPEPDSTRTGTLSLPNGSRH